MEIRLPKVARTPQKVASIMILQKTQIMKKTRRMLQSLRHSSMRETMTTTPLTQKCGVHDVKRELPLQQQRHPRLQAGTVMRKDWMLAALRSRHPHCICSRSR